MDNRKLKKQREAAAKLSRPRPVELPSGRWRCQVMVNGKRIDVIEDDPAVAHAKALAVKAGLMEEQKPVAELTVGQAIDRYIDSKDAVLSPSTIRGYKSLQKGILLPLHDVRLADLTQEAVQRFVNRIARDHSPKTVKNVHGLISAALSVYRPEMVLLNVPDKYAMERMGHASNNMLKNVYQHTMRKKSEEVADMVDSYFESNLHTDLHTS